MIENLPRARSEMDITRVSETLSTGSIPVGRTTRIYKDNLLKLQAAKMTRRPIRLAKAVCSPLRMGDLIIIDPLYLTAWHGLAGCPSRAMNPRVCGRLTDAQIE